MRARLFLPVLLLASCAYRPARFADRPPALRVDDRSPVPMPAPRGDDDASEFTESFFRGPLVDALDPDRTPAAGDVNAIDEVPESSWFAGRFLEDVDGPPVAPFAVGRAASDGSSVAIRDARGLAYELVGDSDGAPMRRSVAAVVASRLVRALGFRAAEASAIDVSPADFQAPAAVVRLFAKSARVRVAAVRWPIGVDLGPTPPTGRRDDDPSDLVAHEDRRVLRSFGVVAAWLAIDEVGFRTFRDAYVGADDRSPAPDGTGHVVHVVVGLDSALGVGRSAARDDRASSDEVGDPLTNLVTLGFAGLGARHDGPSSTPLGSAATPREFRPILPYHPIRRARPDDAYWAGKRLALVSPEVVRDAVRAARLDGASEAALAAALEARRREAIEVAFRDSSPIEVVSVESGAVVLRDVERGLGLVNDRAVEVQLLDDDGNGLTPRRTLAEREGRIVVPLPPAPGYVVLRATIRGRGTMEAHFERSRMIAVRHGPP